MALGSFNATIVNSSGDIVPGAEIEVRRTSDNALANLFSDESRTAMTNPFNAHAVTAFAQFFAERDTYTVAASTGAGTVTWNVDVTPSSDGATYAPTRAEAILLNVPAAQVVLFVRSGAGLLAYKRDAAGTAITTADGQTWSPDGEVWAEHFGAVGSGSELVADGNYTAWQAAIEFCEAQPNGASLYFKGRHVVNGVLEINGERIALIGAGPAGENAGVSDLRGHHMYGPVLRMKGDRPVLRDFIVSSTSARRAAPRVTKDNFAALGLTRDDQNFGIWLEPDDNDTDFVDDPEITNVWSHNQPNEGMVMVGGGYVGRIDHSGAKDAAGHGLIISSGGFTGRTNKRIGGVLKINSWSSRGCKGHGFVAKPFDDDVGLSAIRVIISNMDNYNNCNTPSLLLHPYESILEADNSTITDSGFNGRGLYGALALGGRNVAAYNTRLLAMGSDQLPIRVLAGIGDPNRPTEAIHIERMTCPVGSFSALVEVQAGAVGVRVIQDSLDGTSFAASTGVVREFVRATVRAWFGVQLWGKNVNNTTDLGGSVSSDGGGAYISMVRSNITAFFDRTGSGENVRFLRAGVSIGQVYTDSGTIALFSSSGKNVKIGVASGPEITLTPTGMIITGIPESAAAAAGGQMYFNNNVLTRKP